VGSILRHSEVVFHSVKFPQLELDERSFCRGPFRVPFLPLSGLVVIVIQVYAAGMKLLDHGIVCDSEDHSMGMFDEYFLLANPCASRVVI
jgi:hypothetical protein